MAQDGPDIPPGPNRDLVYGKCRTCHDLQYLVESAGVPRTTWGELLDSMKQYGLELPKDERAKILEYLGTYLGPNPPPKTAAAAPAETAGRGRRRRGVQGAVRRLPSAERAGRGRQLPAARRQSRPVPEP